MRVLQICVWGSELPLLLVSSSSITNRHAVSVFGFVNVLSIEMPSCMGYNNLWCSTGAAMTVDVIG